MINNQGIEIGNAEQIMEIDLILDNRNEKEHLNFDITAYIFSRFQY
jgi:hypothetical protein